MKKTSILYALVMFALCANAQVTLLGTLTGETRPSSAALAQSYSDWKLPVQYFYAISYDDSRNESIVKLYDVRTLQLSKVIIASGEWDAIIYAGTNFWTTDGSVALMLQKYSRMKEPTIMPDGSESGERETTLGEYCIVNESGSLNQKLMNGEEYGIVKTNRGYQFYIVSENTPCYIYSIPGTGSLTPISEIQSKSSQISKTLYNGQILIHQNCNIFDIFGRKVN